MFVDFVNGKSKYRCIAVYMPHSNLSHELFSSIFEILDDVIADAVKQK